jgi:hypothetical protein
VEEGNVMRVKRKKEMRLLRASKLFEAPKSTLKNKVKSAEQNIEKSVNNQIGRKPVFSGDLENALVSYCLIMGGKIILGLTIKDVGMGAKLCTFLLHM